MTIFHFDPEAKAMREALADKTGVKAGKLLAKKLGQNAMHKIDFSFLYADIYDELVQAQRQHGKSFASLHEAYAVLLEELDEIWDITRKKRGDRSAIALHREFVQLAAMAIRAIQSLDNFVGGEE